MKDLINKKVFPITYFSLFYLSFCKIHTLQ